MTDTTSTPDAPDAGYPMAVEPPSPADLAESVQALRNWLIVLTVLLALVSVAAVGAIVMASISFSTVGGLSAFMGPDGFPVGAGSGVVQKGPALSSVESLPLDASGEGTIQGVPTGEAVYDDAEATFVLVLDPAPAGLPPRTTLNVALDHTTKVYRSGQARGDALAALNSEGGPSEADPTAVLGTVTVRFHIKDGRVFADRIDLSN